MWPNPQFCVDLVTFTEEIINEKLHFLCIVPIAVTNISIMKVSEENCYKLKSMEIAAMKVLMQCSLQ